MEDSVVCWPLISVKRLVGVQYIMWGIIYVCVECGWMLIKFVSSFSACLMWNFMTWTKLVLTTSLFTSDSADGVTFVKLFVGSVPRTISEEEVQKPSNCCYSDESIYIFIEACQTKCSRVIHHCIQLPYYEPLQSSTWRGGKLCLQCIWITMGLLVHG